MSTQSINPYDILHLRRKLKQWKKTSPIECMKILKKVRQMKLDNQMIIATEFSRTMIWVANRTRDSSNDDVSKMNKMCRFLAKQWRKQLGVEDKKKQEGQKKPEGQQKKQVNENEKKVEQQKKE